MKRISSMFCTALLLSGLLRGCMGLPGNNILDPDNGNITDGSSVTEPDNTKTEDSALTALQQKINYHSKGAGVAFIGYVDSESTEVPDHLS